MVLPKGRRGKEFEEIVEGTFSQIPFCTVVKTDPPVAIRRVAIDGSFTGVFKAKGACDFEGGYRGMVVCIEAKDCHSPMFLKDRIRTHQMERMQATDQMRGLAGLLLRFNAGNPNKDVVVFIEYRSLEDLFRKRSRFSLEDLHVANSYALRYVPLIGGKIGLGGIQNILDSQESSLRIHG